MPARLATLLLLTLASVDARAAAELALSDCRLEAGTDAPTVKARCGRLARPEDPDDPDGRWIELRVAVVPAFSVDPESDPLVLLAGGPGQAATEFYVAYRGAFEGVRRDRSILLVDQRGTGGSARLDCEEIDTMLDVAPDLEDIGPLVEQCLEDLEGDARFYTTSVAVEDLEAVREALGYRTLNLYGISYGTRVAQHYLRRYPDSTRTVVLDGVIPAGTALGPDTALFAQASLDAIFRRCESSPDCSQRFPGTEANFAVLDRRLREQAMMLDLVHPTSGERIERRFSTEQLATAVRLLSYSPATAALLPHLIHEASAGNIAPLAAQSLMIETSLSASLALGMHNSVVCAEDLPYVEEETIDRQALAQTYMGERQIEMLLEICRHWPRGVIDPDFREPLDTDVPVLLLSGEYDPVTPPAWGDIATAQFDNARHLIGPGQGHGLAPQGCLPRVIAEFVEAASVADLAAECVARLGPMPFFIDFNGPAP